MGPWMLMSLLLLVQGAPPPPGAGLLAPRRAADPANATIFSHIYSIRRAACEGCRGAGPEPPQEALGPPSQPQPPQLYEHTLEGDEQVVFTHRINLPPQACSCEGGAGADSSALREALSRLRALEAQVQALREQCGAGGCRHRGALATAQAGTGQTDTQRLCSQHGTFDLAACRCVCRPGWAGPTCAEPGCPGGCGERGECLAGRCLCPPDATGARCETPVCPDECNDQGRCLAGRCACFPGYTGPACDQPACPGDCGGRGECRHGECRCREGYAGEDCGIEIPAVTLRVGRRDEGSFRLHWARPKTPVDGYDIRLVPTGDPEGTVSLRLPGSATSFERSGLGPGQEFNVTVRAERAQRLGPPTSQSVRTRIDAPRGLRPTGATATSLSLRWDPPAALPDGYTLRYGPVGQEGTEPPARLALPPDRTTLTLHGLQSATRYALSLTARRGPDESPPARASASTGGCRGPGGSGDVGGGGGAWGEGRRTSGGSKWGGAHECGSRVAGQECLSVCPYVHLAGRPSVHSSVRLADCPSVRLAVRPSVHSSIHLSIRPSGWLSIHASICPSIHLVGRPSVHSSIHLSIRPFALMLPLPLPGRPHPEPTRPPVPHLQPPGPAGKPGPQPSPANASSLSGQPFLRTVALNLPAKLARYNGTLLHRLESYLRATRFPLQGNQTFPGVARAFYLYLLRRKLVDLPPGEPGATAPAPEEPTEPPGSFRIDGEVGSIFSEGSPGSETRPRPHAKPAVLARSPGSIVVSLDGLRGHSERVVIRYRPVGRGGAAGELVVPGDAATARLHGLAPGTTYHVEIHGVVRGRSSKSYSFVASTAPEASGTKQPTEPPPPSLPSPGDLAVTDVSPDRFRVTWTAGHRIFQRFLLRYGEPGSTAPPRQIEVPGGQRSVAVTELSPGTEYKLELQGVTPDGTISEPVTTSVSTAPLGGVPGPSVLGGLGVQNVTSEGFGVQWKARKGLFQSFLLRYEDVSGWAGPQEAELPGAERATRVGGLRPGTEYNVTLYGVHRGQLSPPLRASVRTAAAQPEETPAPTPSLGELSASDVTHDSALLSWTVQAGDFDSFLLQYKDAEGRAQALPVDGGSRSVTVTSLVPSRRYKFNLYGISGRKRLGPVSTDAVTATAPSEKKPGPPPSLGELSASDVTHDSALLSWTVQAGDFDSFLLQYKDAEGRPQALPVDGGSRSVTVTSLAPSRRYKFNLYGISGRKRLGPVSTDAVTAAAPSEKKPGPPPSLGELSASDVTHDSARLSWTVQAGDFDSFLLQYKDAEGRPQALPVDGGSRSVTVTSLAPSRRYKFNLYGVSGRKRLGPVSTDAVTAPPKEVPAPTPSLGELSASDVTHDSALLSWTVQAGDFDSFLLQYKDAEGRAQALPVDGGSRSVTVTSLAPSRRYKFNLYGVSGRKRLSPISTEAVTAAAPSEEVSAPPPSLGELSASDVTHDSALLSWTVQAGDFDSFLLQYKDAEGRPQALPVDGGSRSVTVTSLAPSRRYKFNLYGVSGRKRLGPVSTDAVTAAAPSEEVSAPPPSLGELSASDVTHDSALLSWTVQAGDFDSFLLQYKDAEGRPQALPVDGGSRSVTVTSLAPSRRYKFNLYGISGRKRLGPVSTDTVTAAVPPEEVSGPPPSLGELSASDVTHDSVLLSWTVQAGDLDSFLLQYKDAEGRPQALPVDGGSRSVTVTSLAPSRRYKFNLYGVSGRKRLGPVSTDTVTAAAQPEEKPTPQPSLGELSASDITHDSALLSWTVQAGDFDSFILQYKDMEGKPQALPVDGGSRSVSVTNLAPSRRYKFNLYGVSGRKRLGPVSTEAVTASAPSEKKPIHTPSLGELSASDVTHDSALLSWTVQAGDFDSFLLQYKDAEGRAQALPVDGGSRSVTVTSLAPSRRYKFNLYGVSGRKRLGPVSTDTVTAAVPPEEVPTPPPSLGELSASDVTHDSALLSWTVQAGAFDSFLLQYKDAEGRAQALPVDGGSRSVTVTSLAPSRRYKFNLYGVSGHKRLGPVSTDAVTGLRLLPGRRPFALLFPLLSSAVGTAAASQHLPGKMLPRFQPPGPIYRPLNGSESAAPTEETPTPPPSLGELSASNVTHDSALLFWTVQAGDFDSFLLQYKDAEGKPQALPVDGGSRSVTVTSLASSRRYKFNLYGISGRNRLGPVSTEAVTAAAPSEEVPPSLGELSASDVTHDSALLSWTVQAGDFDSFLLQYKDAEGRPQALPVDGGSRSVTVTSLAPSRRYKFNLYGISGRKRLGPVSTDAVTAAAPTEETPTPPPSLGELSASDMTHDSTLLSWTVQAGDFDSFLLQYKDAEGRPQALPVDGGSRSVTVTSLAPSRRYKFNLYGISGRKRLGPISTDAVTAPPEEVPPSLGALSASDVTHDSALLSWTVQAGDFDSFLLQYKDAEGRPQALPVDGGSRSVTVTSLAPSRRYKFNFYGVSGRKRLGPISTDAVTAAAPTEETPTPPPSLGELSASNVTHDSALLSWTVQAGDFDSFLLQYKDAEGKPQALPMDGGSRSVTVTSLAPSRRYKFNLYGVSGRKRLGPISTEAVTGGVAAGNPGKWDPLCRHAPSICLSPDLLPSSRVWDPWVPCPLSTPFLSADPLRVGIALHPPLSVSAAVPPKEEPAPPPSLGELSASDVTHDSALLSWTVQAGDFDSFILQYKDVEGKPQALPVDGGSRSVTVTSLAPSRRYKFNLYGVFGRKRLGPISTDTVTAAAPQEGARAQLRLGELSAANAAHDSLDLSWTVQEGTFDSFLLQYRDAEGNPQALPVDGALRSLHLHDLAPSRRYQFNLYGVSGRKRLGPVSTEAVTAAAPTEETPTPPPSLGELSASDVTHDSTLLSWTVQAGDFDSFLLQYKDAEGRPQALPVDGGSRSVTVTSLVPSRRYKFNLYGVSGRKRLGPVSTEAVTAAVPSAEVSAPTPSLGELSASDVTHDSALLSWTVQAGDFDSFLLQYKDAEGRPQALPVDGGSRSVTVTSLAPSRRYKFNLYGVSGRKRLGPVSTEAVTAAVPSAEVSAPTPSLGELSASDVTHDSALLSWTVQAGDFDSFLLQYKDAEGRPQALPVDGGSRSVTVTSLAPSRRYKFNLYGISGRKRLGPVSTDAVTAAAQPEETPAPTPSLGELSASDVTHDSARLSWTVQAGDFDSFLLQYKDAEGRPQALPVDGGSRSVTVTSLAPSRRYKFNLYGISGRKRLGPVSTEAVTAAVLPEEEPTLPPSLGELSASDVTHDSALLSWTVQAGDFDSFLLQYKDAEGRPQALPVDGGSRSVTVTSLAPSRRYKFNLYGVSGQKRLGPVSTDGVTAAAPSEEVSAPPPSLGQLSASDVTHDSALLSWTVQAGDFDSFLLQYKDAKGRAQALPVDGGSRSVTVTSLAPSRRYKFNLYGVSGRKRLGPVSTEAVTGQRPPQGAAASMGPFHFSTLPSPILGMPCRSLQHPSLRSAPLLSFLLLLFSHLLCLSLVFSCCVSHRDALSSWTASQTRRLFSLHGEDFSISFCSPCPRSPPRENPPPKTSPPLSVPAVAPPEEEPTAPPSLGELSASNVTHDSALLSWTVQAGDFDSFLLQYKDAEGRPQALPVDGGSRSVTVTSLAPSRRYKFNLYGVSGRKRLGPISTDTVTAAAPTEVTPTPPPSLGELSASDVTHDSALLSWTVQAGDFDSFLLQYKDAEGRPQALPVDGGSRSVTVTSLAPSRRYKFNLYGVSGRKRLGPVSTDAVTAMAPQEVAARTQLHLGELSASDVTHNSALLSWTVEEGTFDSFILQYKDVEGRPQALPVDGGSRSVTVTSLAPSRRYKFNLYGVSGRKRLGPISAEAVTAAAPSEEEPGPPPSLGELSASDVTHDSALLSWTVQAGDFDSFLLQYKDAEGRPQALPVDGGSRSVTVTSLAPSRRYKFNLYGISGRKRLGPVSIDTVTGQRLLPGGSHPVPACCPLSFPRIPPALHRFSTSSPLRPLCRPCVSSSGTLPVSVYPFRLLLSCPRLLPLHRLSPPLPGLCSRPFMPSRLVLPLPRPVAHCQCSTTAHGSTSAAAPPEEGAGTRLRLGELSVSDVTHDSLDLSWTVEEGTFDSFILQYKDVEGRPQALPVDGGSRSVTVTGLAPSRRYKFNLYGVFGRKRLGPVSTDAVTGRPEEEDEEEEEEEEGGAPQPRLGDLSVSEVTKNSVRLSWAVQAGPFDSFLVQYKDAEGRAQALPVDGGSRSLVVSDLLPSRRYTFNLYGLYGRKRLGPVSADAVTGQRRARPCPKLVLEPGLGARTPGFCSSAGKGGAPGGWSKGWDVGGASPGATGEPPARLDQLLVSDVTPTSLRLSWEVAPGQFETFLVRYQPAGPGPAQEVPVPGTQRSAVLRGLRPATEYGLAVHGRQRGKETASVHGAARTGSLGMHPAGWGSPAGPQHPASAPQAWQHPQLPCPAPAAPPSVPTIPLRPLFPTAPQRPSDKGWPGPAVASLVLKATSAPPPTCLISVVWGFGHGCSPGRWGGWGGRGGWDCRDLAAGVSSEPCWGPGRREGQTADLESPRELRFSDVRETSVGVTWEAPAARVDHFKVSYQLTEGGEPQSATVEGGRLQTTLVGLTPGASYEVSVMAVRGFEESEPLVGYVTTAPDGPSDLRVANLSGSTALLRWRPARGPVQSYRLSYGPPQGPAVTVQLPGDRTEHPLSGLQLDTEYQVSVLGVSGGRASSPASASFTTDLDAPRDLRATEVTPRSAWLVWTPPRAPPAGYLLSYETPAGHTQELPLGSDAASYQLHDLTPSSRYHVRLQAIRGGHPTTPIATSFNTVWLTYPFPRDCAEEQLNGPGPSRETTIYLGGDRARPLRVYCDMATDGGGWLVFPRRMNGKTDFWRDWQDYARGFGNLTQEFWLGNEALHALTAAGEQELRVDLRAGAEVVHAQYQRFRVAPASENYRLQLGAYHGTAGDALSYHSGSVFSTRDRDPNRLLIPCAVSYRGAWWYRNCHYANLNGLYGNTQDHQGVNWFNWKGFEFSIPFTEMKLRPRSGRSPAPGGRGSR
ncbi:tenascin-X [Emydura macquarii macquarii]|uniref:tenascin-X n=1 Tax=Emydura macquarii macquarii TaxID=1129001 RepID=UPI00352A1A1C